MADDPIPAFSFAFQPIIDASAQRIASYEVLVRGPRGESAASVLANVPTDLLELFDSRARVSAIGLAGRLGLDCDLNLNVLPRAFSRTSLMETLKAAQLAGIPVDQLVLEVTEQEAIQDQVVFDEAVREIRARGVRLAIDDFGAGFSGLNLLTRFQPDVVKLDMNLIRGIETNGPRQAIVRGVAQVCRDLGIDVLGEGVETLDEYEWLLAEGVDLFQGYLIGKPAFEALPDANFPVVDHGNGQLTQAGQGSRF